MAGTLATVAAVVLHDAFGEREADRVAAFAVELRGAVHPLANVGRDLLVEILLEVGQLVRDGLCDPLREQRLTVEREEVFLDHAPRQPSDLVVCYDVLQYLDDEAAARAIGNNAIALRCDVTGEADVASAMAARRRK